MATTADAELILKLYDLRRETVCRQARDFFATWKPVSAEEVSTVLKGFNRKDNAWMRQATSYWEMAFSLANSGAVDADLFAKNCGEGLMFCLKCQWLKQRFPGVWERSMSEAETFLARSAIAQQKVEAIRPRLAAMLA